MPRGCICDCFGKTCYCDQSRPCDCDCRPRLDPRPDPGKPERVRRGERRPSAARAYPQHRKGVRYPCRCPEPVITARVVLDSLLPICGQCHNEYDPRPRDQWCALDQLLPVARTVLLRDPRHRAVYVRGAEWVPLPPRRGPVLA